MPRLYTAVSREAALLCLTWLCDRQTWWLCSRFPNAAFVLTPSYRFQMGERRQRLFCFRVSLQNVFSAPKRNRRELFIEEFSCFSSEKLLAMSCHICGATLPIKMCQGPQYERWNGRRGDSVGKQECSNIQSLWSFFGLKEEERTRKYGRVVRDGSTTYFCVLGTSGDGNLETWMVSSSHHW